MKNGNKLMAENLENDLLQHFRGLSEKSAVKMINKIESSVVRLAKKFQKLIEDDKDNLEDIEKKEAKKLKKESKKQEKEAKKEELKAKMEIVMANSDEDVIQESMKV
jgi:Sec-independent protein translocase protein TatA